MSKFVVTRQMLERSGVAALSESKSYRSQGSAMRGARTMVQHAVQEMRHGLFEVIHGQEEEVFAGDLQMVTMTRDGIPVAIVEIDSKGEPREILTDGAMDMKSQYVLDEELMRKLR